MSVSFTHAVADGLRAHGIVVHFASGYERLGNGQSSAYGGLIEHHTASSFGMALPGRGIFDLLRDGRRDLSGPLCNSAGNEDGSVTIIAAHPANHAGASGGSWARPFPDTRNFNRMVWGHEIVYPGTTPMRPAQYHTAQILGGVISGILRRPNPEWVRGHYETSITGKFDPGYAPGKWISMADFRAGIWDALHRNPPTAPAAPGGIESMAMDTVWKDSYGNNQTVEGFMKETQRDLNELHAAVLAVAQSRIPGDKNKTNAANLWFDNGSWSAQTLGHVAAIRGMVAGLQGVDSQQVADALRPALAEMVLPVVREAVTDALGADNQSQAEAIVDQISARLATGDAAEG